jgi:Putative transposase DNA-binding domain
MAEGTPQAWWQEPQEDLQEVGKTACQSCQYPQGCSTHPHNLSLQTPRLGSEAIEDLHVADMLKNHNLAQTIPDSNFGEISRQFEYKSSWHGVHLVVIDRFSPSSKTCSACGWIDEAQDLSDRILICHQCGLVIDRDLNAARNILNEALRTTGSCSERYAYRERSAGTVNGRSETALAEVGTNHLNSLSTNV